MGTKGNTEDSADDGGEERKRSLQDGLQDARVRRLRVPAGAQLVALLGCDESEVGYVSMNDTREILAAMGKAFTPPRTEGADGRQSVLSSREELERHVERSIREHGRSGRVWLFPESVSDTGAFVVPTASLLSSWHKLLTFNGADLVVADPTDKHGLCVEWLRDEPEEHGTDSFFRLTRW